MCEIQAIRLLPFDIDIAVFMLLVFLLITMNSCILTEKTTNFEIFSVVIGYVGIIYLTNSKFLLNQEALTDLTNKINNKYPHYLVGLIISFLFALFASLTIISLRNISSEVNLSLRTFTFGVLSTTISLIWISFTGVKDWITFNAM